LSESPGGRFETFDANARFVVVRDHEGYGVWRMEDLEEGDPLERFADDDRAYGSAVTRWKELTAVARRETWLGRLVWLTVGAAVLWVVSSTVSGLLYVQVSPTFLNGSGFFDTLVRWSQVTTFVAQPLTLGSLAVFVVFWLQNRSFR